MTTKTIRTTSPGGLTIIKHPQPVPILYPGAPGGVADPCQFCFRCTPDVLARTCRGCFDKIVSFQPIALPTRDELPKVLHDWATRDNKGVIDERDTDAMLATLLPGLTAKERDDWYDELSTVLDRQTQIKDGTFDLLTVAPDKRDPDRLDADAKARVTEAIDALVGGAL